MKQLILQAGCDPVVGSTLPFLNASSRESGSGPGSGSLLGAIIRGCTVFNNGSVPLYIDIIDDKKHNNQTDSGALFYIVFVLCFYSAGIVVMIVKYLKREQRELQEEKALEDFFRSMPAYKKEREQYTVNQVAIQAFHALTSLSYGGIDDDNVTSDDESSHVFSQTIHEHQEDVDEGDEGEATATTELEAGSDIREHSGGGTSYQRELSATTLDSDNVPL